MSFRILFATPLLALAVTGIYVCWISDDFWRGFWALAFAAFLFSIGIPLLVGGIRKSWERAW